MSAKRVALECVRAECRGLRGISETVIYAEAMSRLAADMDTPTRWIEDSLKALKNLAAATGSDRETATAEFLARAGELFGEAAKALRAAGEPEYFKAAAMSGKGIE